MVPGFHMLARHIERRSLSIAVVCLFWRGVTMGLPCGHECKRVYESGLFVFLWQHIAWFLGTVRCPHGAYPFCEWLMCLSWWSRSDKTERSGEAEKDWKSLWQKENCGDKGKGGAIIHQALAFCFLSDATGMQVVHLKCLHGWLIKGEKLLLLINWQPEPHMSAYSQQCMNRLHNRPLSYLCRLSLSWFHGDFRKSSASLLRLFHSCFSKSLCSLFL